MAEKRRHRISVVVEGVQISEWIGYQIQSSMLVPADRFDMSRAFDPAAWSLLRLDASVQVWIDNVQILDGFIDRRKKHGKDNTMEVSGFDKAGRLFAESAPSISYDGLEMSEAIRRLADPWFARVVLSDARNRRLRLGKGHKVPTGNEPIVVRKATPSSNGKVQPGQSRWQVIEEIVSQAGLLCWASADGRELVVGRPNYQQQAQFVCALGVPGGARTTVKDLDYEEDLGDGYSVIAVVGTGGGTETDYGASVSSRRAFAFDKEPGFASRDWRLLDGTGGDFIRPKRLMMPERNYDSNQDAEEIAERERARRSWKRRNATATMDGHGQFSTLGAMTIFAPNTIATVIDEEMRPALRQDFLVYQCTYAGNAADGETTALEMVPRGTEIVL